MTYTNYRRLSRILTALMPLQAGYVYVPYSSLESVIEQSNEVYYLALRQTQGPLRTERPNWQPWVLFFLHALDSQKNRLAAKVERKRSCSRNYQSFRCASSTSRTSMDG